MRLRPSTLRVRLTLWYAGVLLAILGAVSAGVYWIARQNLERVLARQLTRELQVIDLLMRNPPAGKGPEGHVGGDIRFRIVEGKRLLYHSNAWCRSRLGAGIRDAGVAFDTVGAWQEEARSYRLFRRPITIAGRACTLTVAQDADDLNDTLQRLRGVLLISLPCTLLIAVGGGYFLAGRVLAPLGAMASQAQLIHAESLSRRLPVRDPHDELGRLAMVFNGMIARLETSFSQLQAFTANVSHQLRTPLTAIRSVGEIALEKPLHAAGRNAIGSMLEEVDRLTMLVDSLLMLARAESGRVELHSVRLDLAALTASVAETLRILAEDKGQCLMTGAAVPVWIDADESTLIQGVTNVLDNAIRYTPAGGRIEVSAGSVAGHTAFVEIADSGPGIPPEQQALVFQRFYRIERSGMKGTGLGLALARSFVELNGGKIELVSTAASGSRFRMTFPEIPPESVGRRGAYAPLTATSTPPPSSRNAS